MDAPTSRTTRSPETLEQDAIEAGFVAREAWAFEAAYDAYRKHLYGTAYTVLHDAGDAEDCVHDVLVRLWRNGHPYTRERGSLHAFLIVCVRNEALSRRRRSENRARIARERLHVVEHEPAAEEPAVAHVAVDRAMQHLSDVQQRTVRLAYYDGLTHEQIAQVLGEPVGTIKSRLSNALRAMRAQLSQGDKE